LECWMLELAMYDLLVAYKQFGILDAWTRHVWSSCSILTVCNSGCLNSPCMIFLQCTNSLGFWMRELSMYDVVYRTNDLELCMLEFTMYVCMIFLYSIRRIWDFWMLVLSIQTIWDLCAWIHLFTLHTNTLGFWIVFATSNHNAIDTTWNLIAFKSRQMFVQ
jgi:hypothetical protein